MLSPLAGLYGAIAGRRMAQPGQPAGIPVLCIGNLTVGGAGKTPTAIAAAELLLAAGQRPFFLSRGYGGRLAGPVRVDVAHHRAADVGDEPLLLARVAPTIVARNRVAGAAAARAAGASAVVMDDGFQNPALAKDRSIVVVDGRRGVGNGRVFPAGPLRAPLAAQIELAQAVLVIGPPAGAELVLDAARSRAVPIFHGRLEPDAAVIKELRSRPVLAFAGIGDPDKFFSTVLQAGFDLRARQAFLDHHVYGHAEAADLVARAARDGLMLLTTEKDLARLAGQDGVAALAGVARALPVKLVVTEAERFREWIASGVR